MMPPLSSAELVGVPPLLYGETESRVTSTAAVVPAATSMQGSRWVSDVAVLPAVTTSIDIACARVIGVGVGVDAGVEVEVAVGVEVGVALGVGVGVDVGVEVGVAVGVGVDVGVAVAVEPPPTWTTSCTLLDAASSELKSYPSLLVLSIASERSEPDAAATAEGRSTSSQTDLAVPGVNMTIVAPFD